MADALTLKRADRALLVGASGTGKSTLANYLVEHFRDDYSTPNRTRHGGALPACRILILDTKPRWRAERLTDGRKAARVYKKMSKGDTVPGSVALSDMKDWGMAWHPDNNPSQVVIAQRLDGLHVSNVLFQVAAAERFFRELDYRVPSLIYFDEGMDFFTASSSARGSDIVQRCYRAGRERGLTSLLGVQRPKGINLQLLTELNYMALFRINYTDDVKRLYEVGWPKTEGSPTYQEASTHMFKVWREGKPSIRKFRLTLGREVPEQKAG